MRVLLTGQVIRPGYAWLLRHRPSVMLAEARAGSTPPGSPGFGLTARRRARRNGQDRSDALNKITWMVIRKGGLVSDITVGDCIELTRRAAGAPFPGQRTAGRCSTRCSRTPACSPPAAPARLRALRIDGRRSIAADRRRVRHRSARPVRDLLVEYLTERAPELDHTSLRSIARNLCRLFWRDLEIHHPGIDSLHLAPQVAQAWKERLWPTSGTPTGSRCGRRVNYRSELVFVRAFYQDIARWAADDPARWAPWVAPCPIKAAECTDKEVQIAGQVRRWTSGPGPNCRCCPRCCAPSSSSARHPGPARSPPPAAPGRGRFTAAGQSSSAARGRGPRLRHRGGHRQAAQPHPRGRSARSGRWATVEVLRHTGIRIEEMLELTHHSFIAYTLPTHRRGRADAPGRPVQDRRRAAAAGLTGARGGPDRDHLPGPRRERAPCRWSAPTTCSSRPGARPCRSCSSGATARRTGRCPAATSANASSRPRRPPELTAAGEHRWNGTPHDFRRIFVDRRPPLRAAPAHRRENLRPRRAGHHHGLRRDLPRRRDRPSPGLHRPPPGRAAQRRIPRPHRRRMGRVPRPLRAAEGRSGGLRPRLRHPVRP